MAIIGNSLALANIIIYLSQLETILATKIKYDLKK